MVRGCRRANSIMRRVEARRNSLADAGVSATRSCGRVVDFVSDKSDTWPFLFNRFQSVL